MTEKIAFTNYDLTEVETTQNKRAMNVTDN